MSSTHGSVKEKTDHQLMGIKVWLVIAAVSAALPTGGEALPQPWEVWKDLAAVATIDPGVRTILASSVDPDGGPLDRHSEGDSRFVRVVDGEGVIFETEGAGAVTRIWMTQGDGISTDLDQAIRLRVRIDGVESPVVDLSLKEFFSGRVSPFLPPMVLDRVQSGGGNVSFVPIAFREGCQITLVNAEKSKIWFQVSATLLDKAGGVVSFTGEEDLGEWQQMLSKFGSDPWRGLSQGSSLTEETVSGSVVLNQGEPVELIALDGPDQITGVILRVPQWRLGEVIIRTFFDGQKTVDLRLPWFFGIGNRKCAPVQSLFVGEDQGDAYSYFPMPFHRRARIVVELSSEASSPLKLDFAIRRAGTTPNSRAGVFGAEMIHLPASTPGEQAILLDLQGPGRLAGLIVTGRSAGDGGWSFLEGDETLVVDGETEPSWRGTGVEDFFGGGFYFRNSEKRPTPFFQALHGMTCVSVVEGKPSVSMFRLMPTDGPCFEKSLLFELEGGSTGEETVHWSGVAWYYRSKK